MPILHYLLPTSILIFVFPFLRVVSTVSTFRYIQEYVICAKRVCCANRIKRGLSDCFWSYSTAFLLSLREFALLQITKKDSQQLCSMDYIALPLLHYVRAKSLSRFAWELFYQNEGKFSHQTNIQGNGNILLRRIFMFKKLAGNSTLDN